MEEIAEVVGMIVSALIICYLIVSWILSWTFGSPALIWSILTGGVWYLARSSSSPWIRALSPNAAALSIGFGVFALLYIVVAYSASSDPARLAAMGNLAWFVETTLLDLRTFLQKTFGSTVWIATSVSAIIVLALLSERLGSYRLVSRFVGLQGWLSRLTFALVAATTFTILLPTDFGSEVAGDVTAVSEQIKESLRQAENNASHTLAARIVTASIQQMPEPQQQFYRAFLTELSRQTPSPFSQEAVATAIREEVGVEEVPYDELVRQLSRSGADRDVRLETLGDGGRETLRKSMDLEQRTAARAEKEKKKAREALVAIVFTVVPTPDLAEVIRTWVDVLVDAVSGPLSEAVNARFENSEVLGRVTALWRALDARGSPGVAPGRIRATDLDGLTGNGETVQARAEDAARRAFRSADEPASAVAIISPGSPPNRREQGVIGLTEEGPGTRMLPRPRRTPFEVEPRPAVRLYVR